MRGRAKIFRWESVAWSNQDRKQRQQQSLGSTDKTKQGNLMVAKWIFYDLVTGECTGIWLCSDFVRRRHRRCSCCHWHRRWVCSKFGNMRNEDFFLLLSSINRSEMPSPKNEREAKTNSNEAKRKVAYVDTTILRATMCFYSASFFYVLLFDSIWWVFSFALHFGFIGDNQRNKSFIYRS